MGRCIVCAAKDPKHLCGGCRAIEYCSVECQKKYNPRHKIICKRFQDDDTFEEKEFNSIVIDYLSNGTVLIPKMTLQNLSDYDVYNKEKSSVVFFIKSVQYMVIYHTDTITIKRLYYENKDPDLRSYTKKISTNPKSKLLHTRTEILKELLTIGKFKEELHKKMRSISFK